MIADSINSSVALGVSQIAEDRDRIAIINGSGSSRLTALMKSGGTSCIS